MQTKITNCDQDNLDKFGSSVSLRGTTLLVGTPQDNFDGSTSSNVGSAYIFAYSATNCWVQEKKIRAVDVTAQAYFGASGALGEEYMAVGAPGDNSDTGAVFVVPK